MPDINMVKDKWFYFSRRKPEDVFVEPICKIHLKEDHTIGNAANENEFYWDFLNGKLVFYSKRRDQTSLFDEFDENCGKITASGNFIDKKTVHELLETTPDDAKLNIYKFQQLSAHRSGWPYAIDCLWDVHNSNGVRFDDFLDASFSWKWTEAYKSYVPYSDPWVGVMHNPYNIPFPFDQAQNPKKYFQTLEWKSSINYCKGIYCLSEYLAKWVRTQVDVPVNVLVHPTGLPEEYFTWENFTENSEKRIVQVGWWLRRLTSIFKLPVNDTYKKTMLHLNGKFVSEALNKENRHYFRNHKKNLNNKGTDIMYYLKNLEYDALLARNIVFLDLHDSSANNAIIECIIRNTPMLINRLESVEEYLGKDYPLYFESLSDAAEKVQDLGRIKATYEYLLNKDKTPFTGKYFVDSLRSSEIYRSL